MPHDHLETPTSPPPSSDGTLPPRAKVLPFSFQRRADADPATPRRPSAVPPLARLLAAHRLLEEDAHGMVRVPFLVKGRLVAPPEVAPDDVLAAFAVVDAAPRQVPASWTRVGEAQVLRARVVDRVAGRPADRWQYLVMPWVNAGELIEDDPAALAALANTPLDEVLDLASALAARLADEDELAAEVEAVARRTAELPAAWHARVFMGLAAMLDKDVLLDVVEQEAAACGHGGRALLDGWCKVSAAVHPAPVHTLADLLFDDEGLGWAPAHPEVRALPTRQLHITAGNSPQIPLVSMLRALASKSPAVVKSPAGAIIPGAFLAAALASLGPRDDGTAHPMQPHALQRHLSIVYWPGGAAEVEDALFRPGAFDRVVVWGAPAAVASVKQRALSAKVLTFNPRYSLSLIGREAVAEERVRQTAVRAVTDSLVANQKACIASLVHYVEGDDDDVARYARAVQAVLARFDELAPNYAPPVVHGELKRLKRGRFLDAEWYENPAPDGRYGSAAVVVRDSFPMSAHPMARLVVIRPVSRLEDALGFLHPAVATVGITPEARRLELRDRVAAAGVSNVIELGQSGAAFAGMTHDGMLPLSELVDWKNG